MEKMVTCRTCGAEIAKSAKTCPHCGAARKKRHPIRFLILVVLLAAIGYGIFSGKLDIPRYTQQVVSFIKAKRGSSSNQKEYEQRKTDAIAKGVTPELADFLLSYELFIDDYCTFMESFDSSNPLLLVRYSELLKQATELEEKANTYDESSMSTIDQTFYLESMTRINQRLLEANQKADS